MKPPVLFVPGFPSSHLRLQSANGSSKHIFFDRFLASPHLAGPDVLQADDPVLAGDPIQKLKLLFFELKQYDKLYEILSGLQVSDLVKFGWDWRRPVWDRRCQDGLVEAIDDLHTRTGRRVTVIAHSTGGLLVRHLFESQPADVLPKVERLISFGVPWAGVLRTLELLTGFATFPLHERRRTQEIMARSWAAYDLLPPDPRYLNDPQSGAPLDLVFRKEGNLKSAVSPLEETGWIDRLPADLRDPARQRASAAWQLLRGRRPEIDTQGHGLEVVNVVGWGGRTLVSAEMLDSNEVRFPVEAPGDSEVDGGDGTVPRRSAAWIQGTDDVRLRTYHLPIGFLPYPYSSTELHSALWRNPGARDLLAQCLSGVSLPPFLHVALDQVDYSMGGQPNVRLRAVALDAEGAPLPGVRLRAGLRSGEREIPWRVGRDGRYLAQVPRTDMVRVGSKRRLTARLVSQQGNSDEKVFWLA